MEKQKVSVFRQKNKKGLTALSIVACIMLTPVMGVTMFMPQVLAMLPVLLLAMLGFVGPVSAATGIAVMVALSAMLYGVWGGVCAALMVMPVVLISAVTVDHERPFWEAVAASGVTMFASMVAVIALISALAGSDLITAFTTMMRDMINAYGGLGDMLLQMLMNMGAVTSAEGSVVAELDPKMKEEMISSLVMMTDSVLRLEMPMQIATGAVAAGLLGQAVLRKGMLSRGSDVEYPPLRTWRVPKGWGRILGGTLLALYLLSLLVPQSMNTMFYVFSGVFDQVFALQGIAAVCYMLHKRGKTRRIQAVVFVLGYFLMSSFAMIVGIADQAMDIAHRREELDKLENPFDPRHGG